MEDDDEAFADKMQKLTEKLGEQMAKGAELDAVIRQKLGGWGMSSEWRTYQLHDAGPHRYRKTPKGGVPEFEGDEVPFVSPPDFSGNKWITKTVRLISEA